MYDLIINSIGCVLKNLILIKWFQVNVVRASDVSMLPSPAQCLLHPDRRVAALGGRAVPRARSQRHCLVRGPFIMRTSVSVPLESPQYADTYSEPDWGGLGDGTLGDHSSYYGEEEGFYYVVEAKKPLAWQVLKMICLCYTCRKCLGDKPMLWRRFSLSST